MRKLADTVTIDEQWMPGPLEGVLSQGPARETITISASTQPKRSKVQKSAKSVFEGSSSKLREVADSHVENPFDNAEDIETLVDGAYVSLQDAATELAVDDEALEDIIMDRGIRLVTYGEGSNYYMSTASYGRLKAYAQRTR